MAPINLGTTGLSPATKVATDILLWIGTILVWILWIGLSSAAVTYLAFISSKRIYSYCNFEPVT